MAKHTVNNTMLTLDSREIIKRIDELENHELERAHNDDGDIVRLDDFSKDEAEAYEEWSTLKALANEAEQYSSDWEDGVTLIRFNHFKEHVDDLLEEDGTRGFIDQLPSWMSIDWHESIETLKDEEYVELYFDEVRYWMKAD